jgi:hypothetical protein
MLSVFGLRNSYFVSVLALGAREHLLIMALSQDYLSGRSYPDRLTHRLERALLMTLLTIATDHLWRSSSA